MRLKGLKSFLIQFLAVSIIEPVLSNAGLRVQAQLFLGLKVFLILWHIKRIQFVPKNTSNLVALFFLLLSVTISVLNARLSGAVSVIFFISMWLILTSSNEHHFSDLLKFSKVFIWLNYISLFFPWFSFKRVASRFNGILINPNELGLSLAMLFLFVWTYRTRIPKSNMILLSILPLLIFTGNRSGLIAVVFLVIVSSVSVLNTLFISTSVFLFYSTIIKLLQKSRFESMGKDDLLSGRLIAWEFGWKEFMNYNLFQKFFGNGYGKTEDFFHAVENQMFLNNSGHQGNAHNSFLTLLLDYGFLGTILFILFLGMAGSKNMVGFIIICSLGFVESFFSPSFALVMLLYLTFLNIPMNK